jgi:hypothetical protein
MIQRKTWMDRIVELNPDRRFIVFGFLKVLEKRGSAARETLQNALMLAGLTRFAAPNQNDVKRC